MLLVTSTLRQKAKAWCLPKATRQNAFRMNAAPKRVVDGILDTPSTKPTVFALSFVGRENTTNCRNKTFALDHKGALRLPKSRD